MANQIFIAPMLFNFLGLKLSDRTYYTFSLAGMSPPFELFLGLADRQTSPFSTVLMLSSAGLGPHGYDEMRLGDKGPDLYLQSINPLWPGVS